MTTKKKTSFTRITLDMTVAYVPSRKAGIEIAKRTQDILREFKGAEFAWELTERPEVVW